LPDLQAIPEVVHPSAPENATTKMAECEEESKEEEAKETPEEEAKEDEEEKKVKKTDKSEKDISKMTNEVESLRKQLDAVKELLKKPMPRKHLIEKNMDADSKPGVEFQQQVEEVQKWIASGKALTSEQEKTRQNVLTKMFDGKFGKAL
jgi:hypothetical protein